MTTKIELEKMRFYAYHGVMPQETKVGNDFVVDLILTAPLEQAVKSDELDDTINYAAVYAVVKEQMEDRKSTRLNSSHLARSRMPSSA